MGADEPMGKNNCYTKKHNIMSLLDYAIREFEILEANVPAAAVLPFRDEILALCHKFAKSSHSGGSAPYTAAVISMTLKNLLMYEPLYHITGEESEWNDVGGACGGNAVYQNNRCSALFKDGVGSKAHYLDAIVWKGEEEYDTFTGMVYIDDKDFELISSRQYVKFPFKPKTFYVDVKRVPISKEEAERRGMHYIEDGFGECYYTVVKDTSQLDEVFEYYDRY